MHTIVFSVFINKSEVQFDAISKQSNKSICGAIQTNITSLCKDNNGNIAMYLVDVKIDCLALLRKVNVEKSDIPIIKGALIQFLGAIGLSLDDVYVSRIDYCFNAQIDNPKVRAILINIFQSAATKSCYTKRKCSYIKSVHQSSGAKAIQIYDKTAERRAKNKIIENYEQNVIRAEVQIKSRHIKYKKNAHGVGRTFDEWVNWNKREQCLNDIHKTFFEGDFYTINIAKAKLKKSNLPISMQKRLLDFMRLISMKHSLDAAKAKYSYNTIKKYTDTLQDNGINPFVIPAGSCVTYIENPFKNLNFNCKEN